METQTKGIAIFLTPDVKPHDDVNRVIGRRTRYLGDEHAYLRGYDVVIVAVLKDALRVEDPAYLTNNEDVQRAGGVGPNDRIEVAPVLPEDGGRLSFVTSDPKAIDLACFAKLARHGAGARRRRNQKGEKPCQRAKRRA